MPSTGETGRDRRLLLVWLRLGGGKADLGVGEAQAQLTGTQASFCCSWCRNRHCCSGQRRSDSWEPPGHRSNCREECRGWACAGDQAGRDSCQVRLETSPFIPGDMGLIPDSGNKLSHAEGQLSPLAAMKTQQIITMIMMIIIIMVAQW